MRTWRLVAWTPSNPRHWIIVSIILRCICFHGPGSLHLPEMPWQAALEDARYFSLMLWIFNQQFMLCNSNFEVIKTVMKVLTVFMPTPCVGIFHSVWASQEIAAVRTTSWRSWDFMPSALLVSVSHLLSKSFCFLVTLEGNWAGPMVCSHYLCLLLSPVLRIADAFVLRWSFNF